MNTYKKALDYLRMLERKENLFFSNQVAPQVNCDVLEELVDRETPEYAKCPNGFKGFRYTRFYCPSCNKLLENTNYGYCKHCGQALKYPRVIKKENELVLDWSEDE